MIWNPKKAIFLKHKNEIIDRANKGESRKSIYLSMQNELAGISLGYFYKWFNAYIGCQEAARLNKRLSRSHPAVAEKPVEIQKSKPNHIPKGYDELDMDKYYEKPDKQR